MSNVGVQRQLKDEEYHLTLAYYDKLWRHIVTRYPNEAVSPVCVLGYSAIPIAIELSQWTYPVTYITDTWKGVLRAKKDCEVQAGFFKDFLYFDFTRNIPHTRVVTFIGIIDTMELKDMYNYLDLLLRRSREVVCAVSNKKSWARLLEGRYYFNIMTPDRGDFVILTIKTNDGTT